MLCYLICWSYDIVRYYWRQIAHGNVGKFLISHHHQQKQNLADITCLKECKSRRSANQARESHQFPTRKQPGFRGRIATEAEPCGVDRLGRIPPQNIRHSVSQELATDLAHRIAISNLATGTHPTFGGGWF